MTHNGRRLPEKIWAPFSVSSISQCSLKTAASCSDFKISETAVVVFPTPDSASSGYCWSKRGRNDKPGTTLGLGTTERKRDVSYVLRPAFPNLLFITVVSMLSPRSLRFLRNAPAVPWADAHQQSQPSEDGPSQATKILFWALFYLPLLPLSETRRDKCSFLCALSLMNTQISGHLKIEKEFKLHVQEICSHVRVSSFCFRINANNPLNLILHLLKNKNHYISTKS